MARYIDAYKLEKDLPQSVPKHNVIINGNEYPVFLVDHILHKIRNCPTADVVEVVRCKDCVHSTELDKHCEINRSAYRHCKMWRGEEERDVWHSYKKYRKDYSIVELDGFCDMGERRDA